jgi:hypothetical protein
MSPQLLALVAAGFVGGGVCTLCVVGVAWWLCGAPSRRYRGFSRAITTDALDVEDPDEM